MNLDGLSERQIRMLMVDGLAVLRHQRPGRRFVSYLDLVYQVIVLGTPGGAGEEMSAVAGRLADGQRRRPRSLLVEVEHSKAIFLPACMREVREVKRGDIVVASVLGHGAM